ncbi:sensor histidine kinase [Dyadobacter arcticus]|uniref:Signal transduction histidine kinase internal region domain-containing protein n=1 Tax=Dyadobacter arcticus TaxID=1078754 RepID=A0ABX0UFL2_9BACT|nr:histidine kinase [Dyadobacter arcticus]NIJ50864.1 hypothetical protein [Dyadobacter arcticus]
MFQAKNLWVIHVLGWILFISLPLTIMSREPTGDMQLELLTSGSFWLFFLIYCFAFYFNLLFLIPKLFLKQRYLVYTGIFVASFVIIYISQPFESLIFQKFHQQNEQFGPRMKMPPGPPPPAPFGEERPPMPGQPGRESAITVDFVSLVLFVVIWVVGMAISFSRQWQLSEKKVILSEADKAQAELSFFKAQINPHFLFNTLNNIYSLAISSSENTAPSILKLSQLMRYITEEVTENYVPLADEIGCLKNYIELQKLRLNAKTQVDFGLTGSIMNVKIAPLIFMTFVENAFKFGVSSHHESKVGVRIDVSGNEILFVCRNKVFEQKADQDRVGIGIANTRKRLEFLYPERYYLDIQNADGIFTVTLKLTIA